MSEGDAENANAFPQRLFRQRIVLRHGRIVDQASQQIDLFDIPAAGQGSCQLDDVRRLAASIGVTPQLQVVATDEAVHADEEDVEGVPVHGETVTGHEEPLGSPSVTSIVTIHVPSEWDKTAPQRNAAAYQSLRQTEGVPLWRASHGLPAVRSED